MERAELLYQLKQPKLIADLAAGAIAVLGLFGCFHPSPPVKTLSLSALLAGVGGLAGNTAIASLYAETAAAVLDQELFQRGHALQLSESHVIELSNKVEEWKAFCAQKHQEIETLQQKLAAVQQEASQSQTSLTEAAAQVEESRRHIEALQKRLDALVASQQQERQQFQRTFESLALSVKQFMSESIVEYRDRLLSTIESSARQRPDEYRDRLLKGAKESDPQAAPQASDIVPQLHRLASEVKHVASDHLAHIAKLPHFADPQSFLKYDLCRAARQCELSCLSQP
ncbi:MAG: hypothetical protein SNJ81_18265 [Cyanobacteriota bacterium]